MAGEVHLKVAGSSMLPALWPGDMLSVRPCAASELEPGSIIVFRQHGRLVVHRLIHRSGDRLLTQGDARPRPDGQIRTSDIVGRVDTVVRNGKPVKPAGRHWRSSVAVVFRRSELAASLFLRLASRMSAICESSEFLRA